MALRYKRWSSDTTVKPFFKLHLSIGDSLLRNARFFITFFQGLSPVIVFLPGWKGKAALRCLVNPGDVQRDQPTPRMVEGGEKELSFTLKTLEKKMEDTENLEGLRALRWEHASVDNQMENKNIFSELEQVPKDSWRASTVFCRTDCLPPASGHRAEHARSHCSI